METSGKIEFSRAAFAVYACRAVCPLCYCETCIVEKHRPQWISPAIDETGQHGVEHRSGRISSRRALVPGGDECTRVCPADIRLDLINRKLARVVEEPLRLPGGRPIPRHRLRR